MICNLYSEPAFLFFVDGTPPLLYYTHIPVIVVTFFLGLFVLLHDKRNLLNQLFFALTTFFSLWTLSNLILWTNIHVDYLLLFWSALSVFSSLICVFSIYFVSVFIEKRDVSSRVKIFFLLLISPVLLLAPTYISLTGFDISKCDAFDFEGLYFKFYYSALGLIAFIWILLLLIHGYRSTPSSQVRNQILLLGIGIESFVLFFFSLVFSASYLTSAGFFSDSRIEMYGLFGMMIFMIFISILMVQFKTFNVNVIASQALLVSLTILVSSQFVFVDSTSGTILTSVTLVLTTLIGIILLRGIRREIKQREEITALALSLQKSNEKLKALDKLKSEFISIASHQLRSPLTAIRGYSSMLVEGSYGKLPPKAQDTAERIAESAKYMVSSVEDYLNVSRIESGNMKYEMSDFNLKQIVETIVDEMRPIAMKKGIVMVFRSDCEGNCMIHADIGKTRQVLMNLIDNSMKYTQKGTITVVVQTDTHAKKIRVIIQDTGIGMSPETIEELFDKFVRARNANDINPTGTGLGLYVAKKMLREMHGHVYAESEGEGKGSTFRVEFHLV